LPEIVIRLHPDLADRLIAAGPESGRSLSALWRQAGSAIRSHGNRIAHAPALLPEGSQCAMSVRLGRQAMIIEVDRPGTLIPGRGVVPERRSPGLRSRSLPWQPPRAAAQFHDPRPEPVEGCAPIRLTQTHITYSGAASPPNGRGGRKAADGRTAGSDATACMRRPGLTIKTVRDGWAIKQYATAWRWLPGTGTTH
jgi:hypothetical protein